jgi:hypothetical protein
MGTSGLHLCRQRQAFWAGALFKGAKRFSRKQNFGGKNFTKRKTTTSVCPKQAKNFAQKISHFQKIPESF